MPAFSHTMSRAASTTPATRPMPPVIATPPSTATVVDNRDGAGLVVDGPYVESKEYVVGFWIIEAPDLDVALRLANAGSAACHRRVEVRPVR